MSESERTKYLGWLIVQDGESFLCFHPDSIDYAERGYEQWETDSLDAAKRLVDNYARWEEL